MALFQVKQYPGWGNARDIIAMWKVILEQRASRVVDAPEKQKTITKADAELAVKKMVTDRKPKGDQKNIKRELEEEEMQKLKEKLQQMSMLHYYYLSFFDLRGESHIDFRTQCVIMTQRKWPLHPLLNVSFPDFRQNRKMFQMSLTAKKLDYIFEEPLNLHIIVG